MGDIIGQFSLEERFNLIKLLNNQGDLISDSLQASLIRVAKNLPKDEPFKIIGHWRTLILDSKKILESMHPLKWYNFTETKQNFQINAPNDIEFLQLRLKWLIKQGKIKIKIIEESSFWKKIKDDKLLR